MTEVIRVMIVEDEPPARRRLRTLLEEHPDVVIVSECGDGVTAVEQISELQPDLVFLDVEIPEMTGLQVIDTIGASHMPPVIFVTAYDRYAVQAFDRAAVDYLLKPFDQDRFEQALDRGRVMLHHPDDLQVRLSELLKGARPGTTDDFMPIRTGSRIRMVRVSDIDYVGAAGNYVRIHVGTEAWLVRDSMAGMEERLETSKFARVHRSLLVNVTRVRELEPLYQGEFVLWLHDGTRLVTGRTYRPQVQAAFGI